MENTDGIKALDLNIALERESINPDMISAIKEVFKKFDGKQYTKRFDTALKAVNENLSVDYSYNTFAIDYNWSGRNSVKVGNSWYYADRRETILHGVCETCYESMREEAVYEGRVLHADRLCKMLDKRVEYLNNYANELETDKLRIDDYRKRANQIQALAEKLSNDCPPLIGDIFGIKRYWTGRS